MPVSFRIQEHRAVIRPGKRFDLYAHKSFTEACMKLQARKDIRAVELDFFAVTYMDSTGLGMLLVLHRNIEERAIPIIMNCKPYLRRTLNYANFGQLFQIMPDYNLSSDTGCSATHQHMKTITKFRQDKHEGYHNETTHCRT